MSAFQWVIVVLGGFAVFYLHSVAMYLREIDYRISMIQKWLDPLKLQPEIK